MPSSGTCVDAVFEKYTKMLKIYYTLIYSGYRSGKSGKTAGIKAAGLRWRDPR